MTRFKLKGSPKIRYKFDGTYLLGDTEYDHERAGVSLESLQKEDKVVIWLDNEPKKKSKKDKEE